MTPPVLSRLKALLVSRASKAIRPRNCYLLYGASGGREESKSDLDILSMECGTGSSDHFAAWMTLVGASIALIGGLTGVALSSIFEGRREAARMVRARETEASTRQHERDVRFHDERLNAYVEFMGATTTLFAAASIWLQNGAFMTFANSAGDSLSGYNKCFARVSMLAKPALLRKLREVHDHVEQLVSSFPPNVIEQVVTDSIEVRAAFERVAKDELGID